MGNLLQCSCMKDNKNDTEIKISSACFKKDVKIILNDEDDDAFEVFNAIEDLLHGIKRKKTMIKERRISQQLENIKEPVILKESV